MESRSTEVEWWEREKFQKRVQTIHSVNMDTLEPTLVLLQVFPDDFIVCDFCDTPLKEFPIPAINHYTFCPKCYKKKELDNA